jgi:hypothetical protein
MFLWEKNMLPELSSGSWRYLIPFLSQANHFQGMDNGDFTSSSRIVVESYTLWLYFVKFYDVLVLIFTTAGI